MGSQRVKFWANGVTQDDPTRHVGNRDQEEVGMAEESMMPVKPGRVVEVLRALRARKERCEKTLASIDKAIAVLSESDDAAAVLDLLKDAGIR